MATILQPTEAAKPSLAFLTSKASVPKHPKYQTLLARLESFVGWPGRFVPKTPEELSSAGFFYIGSADRVTCFQCGIILRHWEEEHDPVTEHQRYSENCSFIAGFDPRTMQGVKAESEEFVRKNKNSGKQSSVSPKAKDTGTHVGSVHDDVRPVIKNTGAGPESCSTTTVQYQLGVLTMAGHIADSNPDAEAESTRSEVESSRNSTEVKVPYAEVDGTREPIMNGPSPDSWHCLSIVGNLGATVDYLKDRFQRFLSASF